MEAEDGRVVSRDIAISPHSSRRASELADASERGTCQKVQAKIAFVVPHHLQPAPDPIMSSTLSSGPRHATLQPVLAAIDIADASALRAALVALLGESEPFRAAIASKFLVAPSGSRKRANEEAHPAGEKRAKTAPQAREELTSRFEICKTCREVYDVTENNEEACQTHDGAFLEPLPIAMFGH